MRKIKFLGGKMLFMKLKREIMFIYVIVDSNRLFFFSVVYLRYKCNIYFMVSCF